MSAPQPNLDHDVTAPSPGEADLAREVLGFALLQSRAPGNDEIRGKLGSPHQLAAADVRALPVAELRERLDEIMLSRRADRGLTVLYESGLLGVILPEVTALVGFGEGGARHKDVWRHTIRVVIQAIPTIAVRWGALLHDIGKPKTRSIGADGSVHFLHHAEVGARMFNKLARREGLFDDDELREKLRFLIYNHQRAHQYDHDWTDSATRRFAREMGEHLDDLMALSRADMTTKRKEKRRRFLAQLKQLSVRIEALQAEDAKPKALPKGLGELLITRLQLPPSKLIGDIRKQLEAAVESGELPLQADFDTYIEFVLSNPDRFNLPAHARRATPEN